MHFAAGQPATMRKGVRRLSLARLPQSTLEGSETLSRQQKSAYGCPPLPIPCCWWLCFSLFLSRWFFGGSESVKSNHNQLRMGGGGPWYGTNPGGGHKTGRSWEEV